MTKSASATMKQWEVIWALQVAVNRDTTLPHAFVINRGFTGYRAQFCELCGFGKLDRVSKEYGK